MRKNTLKKAMAVMISATMLVTGYTVVSAEGFTDAEALAEMDAFTTGDEAVYVEEVQPEAAQTEEVQPEPVSYTHLDVYKRQASYSLTAAGSSIPASISAAPGYTFPVVFSR